MTCLISYFFKTTCVYQIRQKKLKHILSIVSEFVQIFTLFVALISFLGPQWFVRQTFSPLQVGALVWPPLLLAVFLFVLGLLLLLAIGQLLPTVGLLLVVRWLLLLLAVGLLILLVLRLLLLAVRPLLLLLADGRLLLHFLLLPGRPLVLLRRCRRAVLLRRPLVVVEDILPWRLLVLLLRRPVDVVGEDG